MTVYNNPQGEGLFLVLKYKDGKLDTGSYTGSYAYKPPARMYNTIGKAKTQWTRFIKAGYQARVAAICLDEQGSPEIKFVDAGWVPATDLCKHEKYGKKCKLPKDHEGIHQ